MRLSTALSLAYCTLVSVLLVSCGGAPGGGQLTVTNPSEGGEQTATEPTAEQTAADVQALATDVIAPQLCPRLIGSFVGLPGNETAEGRAAGGAPSVGRWWIRQCDAQIVDGQLSLRIGGMGWTWVDQEASGFQIRQYLLFEADAQLVTRLEVAYDHDKRIASLWMRPTTPTTAHITPRGVVQPRATSLFGEVVGAVAAGTVSETARQQVESIGSERLATQLGQGFTMTLALDRQQVDFMVGALPRGMTPERPFPDLEDSAWLLNQRVRVQPGGLDVVGPIAPVAEGERGLAVDVELEEGPGVVLSTACMEPTQGSLDARFRDPTANTPPPPRFELARIAQAGSVQHVALPRAPCPLVLMMSLPDGATLSSKLRFRVAPERATPTTTAETPRPARPTRVRIQLASVIVSPTDPSGSAWDMFGGAPDLYVIAYSVAMSRELDRAPQLDDHTTAEWSRWLPGVYELAAQLPIRFTVMDDDLTGDSVVGTAVLTAAEVPDVARELELPLLGEGATAPRTGSLRLRFEAVP